MEKDTCGICGPVLPDLHTRHLQEVCRKHLCPMPMKNKLGFQTGLCSCLCLSLRSLCRHLHVVACGHQDPDEGFVVRPCPPGTFSFVLLVCLDLPAFFSGPCCLDLEELCLEQSPAIQEHGPLQPLRMLPLVGPLHLLPPKLLRVCALSPTNRNRPW